MERGEKESFLWSYEYDRLGITRRWERERESYALSGPQDRYRERDDERWLSHIFNLLRIFSYELCAKVLVIFFQALKTNQKCIEYDFFRYLIVTGLERADVNLKCSECRTQIICFEYLWGQNKDIKNDNNYKLTIKNTKKTISSRKFFIVSLNFKINKSWLVVVAQTQRRP